MTGGLTFRPHHFLCALGYRGKGYSDAFTANMTQIVTNGLFANGGDHTLIRVRAAADSLCAPCPKRRGEGCTNQAEIDALDGRHAAALNLKHGDVLTWGQAKMRIREKVRPDDLDTLCTGCKWLELGLCKSALSDLHRGA